MSAVTRTVSWARGTYTLQLSCGHAVTIVATLKPNRRVHPCKECEAMLIEEAANKEIASFQADGTTWYDGISWIPRGDMVDTDRDKAYEIVFAKLLENGRNRGYKDPYVHHNGNGHYIVVDRTHQTRTP